LLAARALRRAHLLELLLGAIAAVGLALAQQPLGDLAVAREALHLAKRPLVPVEPQPPHPVEDRLHGLLGGALEVGVLDAQDELACFAAGVGPGEQRGPRSADVKVARRARGEARSDHGDAFYAMAPDGPAATASLLEFRSRAVSSAVE